MYVVDKNTVFNIVITAKEGASVPAVMDLLITDPDGVSEYVDKGAKYNLIYKAPIPPVSGNPGSGSDGSAKFNRSFNKDGRWIISLTTGNSDVFVIMHSFFLPLSKHTPLYTGTLRIYP